ncbi:L-cysteine desulfidase family protein [Lacticaseibacillus sp. GG6-2]
MNDTEMFLENLHAGVVPATGCTEPIAVAFAAANCMAYLEDDEIQRIDVAVSPNVLKNAMAVMVPGVGEPGLKIAAAAGAISGDHTAGLSVIAAITPEQLPAIKTLAHSGKVHVGMAKVDDDLYVEVGIKTLGGDVRVYIAGDHTNIFRVEKGGQRILDHERPAAHEKSDLKTYMQGVTFKRVWDFATTTPLEGIAFMKDADTINWAIAEEGLQHDYGLRLGQSFDKARALDFGSGTEDLHNMILAYTTAASDARMGGASLPAMSNSGSGNQGISATVPVSVVARSHGASEEQLIRAQTLSHLTAIYAHAFLPVLGAFCATDTAAMGAAAGICYLLDKGYDVACMAIKNMAGDAPGMVCDGAGASCAMKVGTSVSSMYRSVNLALQGVVIPSSNGMVCDDIDETIRGIGHLGTEGMRVTDAAVLDVMMHKDEPRVTVKP